jgi:NAD-dependent DNA ligase
MNPKERHFTQVRWILAQRYRYYVTQSPVYSDIDFDNGFKVLEKLEADNKNLVTKYSPTQYVQEPPMGWGCYFAMPRANVFRLFYKRGNDEH